MAYDRTVWVPGSAPGISADRLNKMEDQHVLSDQHINRLVSVHGATASPTPSRIVQRSPTGTAEIATPVTSGDIANKGYVDGRSVQTRLNNGVLEYWNGSQWVTAGPIPMGNQRTAAGNGGAHMTWTTIANISGVSGRIDSARVNGIGTTGIRVTIDGAVDTVYAGYADRDGSNNYWYLRDTQAPIYFYSSFKLEVYSDDYNSDDDEWRTAYGEAKYRLKAGTP